LARKGAVIEAVPARQVKVMRFDLLSFQHGETGLPVATARIECGAGTYIRSLARDLGEMLGCGGCLSGLVRERSGPFTLDNALTLDALESAVASDQLAGCITAPSEVIGGTPKFPHIAVNDEIGRRIFNGQKIDLNQLPPQFHAPEMSGAEKIFVTAADWLLSVCRIDSGLLRSQVVINHGNETD
jgi:tRNA pseudouridine55 synthase